MDVLGIHRRIQYQARYFAEPWRWQAIFKRSDAQFKLQGLNRGTFATLHDANASLHDQLHHYIDDVLASRDL